MVVNCLRHAAVVVQSSVLRHRLGSEVADCYVSMHVDADVERIGSWMPIIFLHFCVDGMVLGTKIMVH